MLGFIQRSHVLAACCIVLTVGIAGCGSSTNGLPSTVTVELPDGSAEVVTLGSGVVSFADSRWQFYQTSAAAQGVPFAIVRFGPEGELEAFEDNTIASSIFGSEIIFDGAKHPTTQQGLSYAAATFGAQTSDSQGFAFEGRLTAFAAMLEAANATASAVGEFDGDDINTVRGTFTFSSRMTLLDIPEGNMDLSFDFMGTRIIE